MTLDEREKRDFAINYMLEKRKENKELIGEIRLCDRCGIGSGVTEYGDGYFTHQNKCLFPYRRGGKVYEVCEQCLAECKAGHAQPKEWYCERGTWKHKQNFKDAIKEMIKAYAKKPD